MPVSIDSQLLQRLPLPLAQLYRRAVNARQAWQAHQAAYYLGEASVKLLASAAIAEYVARGEPSADVATRIRNLARPTTGHWWELCRLLVPILARRGDAGFQEVERWLLREKHDDLPRLAAARLLLRDATDNSGDVRVGQRLHDQLRSGPQKGNRSVQLRDVFDLWVSYRNRAIGHGASGMHPESYYKLLGDALLLAMVELHGRFDILAGRKQLFVREVKEATGGGYLVDCDELIGEYPSRVASPLRVSSGGGRFGGIATGHLYAATYERDDSPAGVVTTEVVPLQPMVRFEESSCRYFFLNAHDLSDRGQYLSYVDSHVMDQSDARTDRHDFFELLDAGRRDKAPTSVDVPTRLAEPSPRTPSDEADEGRVPEAPSRDEAAEETTERSPRSKPRSVVLLYKRHAEPDETLLATLERRLTQAGYSVFLDRKIAVGAQWARELENRLRHADAVIPLLSPSSIHSELLAWEVQFVHETSQKQGSPRLFPVRVNDEGPLPSELGSILNALQYYLWRDENDDETLVQRLITALESPPGAGRPPPVRPPRQETTTPRFRAAAAMSPPPTGVMPLDADTYIVRPSDAELELALKLRESTILVRGPRQVGKTSLLARGMDQARRQGDDVAITDFQRFNSADLTSIDDFYMRLAEFLVDDLNLDVVPQDVWERRGSNDNFERFLRRQVLEKLPGHLVWLMDEVDRVFDCPFFTEFFGLLRTWHNARVTQPRAPWRRLTLVIAHATEAHLFIQDLNQSPFNVGTRIEMRDFSLDDVRALNGRYGGPLRTDDDIVSYFNLLGGHPYLSNRGLHELVARPTSFGEFVERADRNDGIFGDHLRRMLILLLRDESLRDVVHRALSGGVSGDPRVLDRLRRAGVLTGDSPRDMRFRSRIYASYLREHLL